MIANIGLNLDEILWENIGNDENPESRMLTTVKIGNVYHHLEAIEVKTEDWQDGYGDTYKVQTAVDWNGNSRLQDLIFVEEVDGGFSTVEINGRNYVLIMMPYPSSLNSIYVHPGNQVIV